MRVEVHVKPGASRTEVGGTHDGALVVRVTARAVDGKATEAVLSAVAAALGVPARDVTLVSGATSRRKLLEVVGDDRHLNAVAAALRGNGSSSLPRA